MAQRIEELQRLEIISKSLPRGPAQFEAILPAYFSDPSFEMPSELRNLVNSPAANQLTWSALGEFDFRADVAQIDHPVLLLWGEDDPFGLAMAEATRTALSNASVEFVLLDHCGHWWQECPDPFYFHVRSFFDLPISP
jgi:pimeloyl-ACP methyl ester carboxylesterase